MDVVIVGAGGHGKVVVDILCSGGVHRPVAFLDADPSLLGTRVAGLEVMGSIHYFAKLRAANVRGAIVAIGDNRTRLRYAKHLVDANAELINAIHPSAIVSDSATIGSNVVIAPRVVVGPESRIGDSVILNTACVIEHECEIGRAVHVCPMAALAGRVRVGDGAFIGLGAKIIPCLQIGKYTIIGAGATVIGDIPTHATAVGVPAQVIRRSVELEAESTISVG